MLIFIKKIYKKEIGWWGQSFFRAIRGVLVAPYSTTVKLNHLFFTRNYTTFIGNNNYTKQKLVRDVTTKGPKTQFQLNMGPES